MTAASLWARLSADRLVEGELPERTRNVFLLARLENMRQAEIARRLGVSVSGVEKHLARAIAHLSQRLGRAP